MKSKLFLVPFLLALTLLFTNCSDDKLDITLREVSAGNLIVTFKDNAGNALANIDIKLSFSNSQFNELEEKTTDANGVVEFKDILSGNYYIVAQDVKINGQEYNVVQLVQVITGLTKSYDIDPSEYSGTGILSVIDTDGPLPGINAGIFKREDYEELQEKDFESIQTIVIKKMITDEMGKAEFTNLAVGQQFGVIIYEDSDTYQVEQNSFYISHKGGESIRTIYYTATSPF